MTLRVAVVGCGAIAEMGHVPAAQITPDVVLSILIDTNLERAKKLADSFGVGKASADLSDVRRFADAAIVALPHHLHCSVSVDLLSQGVHVLIEKPMAVSVAECRQMIEAAHRSGKTLAVGMMRRFSPSCQFVKQAIDKELLGKVVSFDIQDGFVYSWSSATPFILSKTHSGGGVLIGNGSHVFDTLVWWLGDPISIDCETDARGGIESDATVRLNMRDGIEGCVTLSRCRMLKNQAIVHFERGSIEVPTFGTSAIVRMKDSTIGLNGTVEFQVPRTTNIMVDALSWQISDWVTAIQTGNAPLATGEQAMRSIALIEKCFELATPVTYPWERPIKLGIKVFSCEI